MKSHIKWETQLGAALLLMTVTMTASADYRDEVLADNPIGYWRLTETDENAPAADETANNRPLTYNNFTSASFATPGPFIDDIVTAPSFVTDDQNSISASDPLDFGFAAGQSFSYDFFLRTSPAASPNQVGVVTKGYTTTNQVLPWYLSRIEQADGATEFFTRNTAAVSQQANGIIDVSDESWHHITAVYDVAAAENRIYVDGVLDAVKTDVPEDDYGTNSEVFTLGTHFDRFFTGQLAEVAIYDQALTEERIQAHFDAAVLVPELPGDFNFDGNIDLGDYDVLLENFNTGRFYAQGDMNLDVNVGLGDFILFRSAFQAANPAVASVPEPNGVVLAISAMLCLSALVRRRRTVV